MTMLAASVVSSIAAWLVDRVIDGHVSESTSYVVSFLVGSIVFVPSYVWLKRIREGG